MCPKNSIEKGIGLLNQDPLDFSNLSIFESFLIGINEKNPYRNINKIRSKIEKLFNNYRVTVDLNSKTNSLSIGERQQVELLRLLYNGAKLIILDEPTSAFSLEQKKRMFDTLRQLSKEGIIIIFVSHKLDDASCYILVSAFFDTSKARGRIHLYDDRAMIRPENVDTHTI